MSRRPGLREKLAEATVDILGNVHALTPPNFERYVKPHLTAYDIRAETDITFLDIQRSLTIAAERQADSRKQTKVSLNTPTYCPSKTPPVDWRDHLAGRLEKFYSGKELTQCQYLLEVSQDRQDFARRNKARQKGQL